MNTRRTTIALGLSALMPMLAQAQTRPRPKAAGDSLFGCGANYGYAYSAGYRSAFTRAAADTVKPAAPPTSPVMSMYSIRLPKGAGLGPITSFEQALFSPELVMQRQDALALTGDQRKTITETLKTLETETIDLQWKLQAEQTKLIELLEQRPINEGAAAAQMARLRDVEASVKQKHFQSLVRIKNTLTDVQVRQLELFQRCGR